MNIPTLENRTINTSGCNVKKPLFLRYVDSYLIA